MFSLLKHKHTMMVAMLLTPVMAGGVRGATMDDELAVDPTMPLSLLVTDNGDELNVGDAFGLLGFFTSYELNSVLIREQDRIAVINDERVRVGDKVGSAVVTAIEAGHVTLNVDGEIQTLKLYENSIKTLVTGDD